MVAYGTCVHVCSNSYIWGYILELILVTHTSQSSVTSIAGNDTLHIVGPRRLAWDQWFLGAVDREFHVAGSVDGGGCHDSAGPCVCPVADDHGHQGQSLAENNASGDFVHLI